MYLTEPDTTESVRNCEQCGRELEPDNPGPLCFSLHKCDICDRPTENLWTKENELLCDVCLDRRAEREDEDANLMWAGIEPWEVAR